MKQVDVGTFLEGIDTPFEAVTVHEAATLREILDTMLRHGEERNVFVVDGEGVLKGVVSLGTLARHFMHEGVAPPNGFSSSTQILHYLTAENAADIMQKEVVFCTRDESLEAASKKMLGQQVYKELPVLDTEHRIIGTLNLISVLEFGLE